MSKPSHEESLSQPIQTNYKEFKIVVSFLTSYNGFFNVTNKDKKVIFISVFEGGEYIVRRIPRGAY